MFNEQFFYWGKVFPRDFLIQEIFHGVIAIPFAYLLYKKTKSKNKFFMVILSTYLIDLDHLFDYFLYFGSRFNLNLFLSGIYFEKAKKAFVPFHAWEWLLILWFLARKKGWESFYAVVTLGLLAHLIFDSVTIGKPLFYFIIYRYMKDFSGI